MAPKIFALLSILFGIAASSPLQIFREGSTETPKIYANPELQQGDPSQYDPSYLYKKGNQEYAKQAEALQKDKKFLELYQQQVALEAKKYKSQDPSTFAQYSQEAKFDKTQLPADDPYKAFKTKESLYSAQKAYAQTNEEKLLQKLIAAGKLPAEDPYKALKNKESLYSVEKPYAQTNDEQLLKKLIAAGKLPGSDESTLLSLKSAQKFSPQSSGEGIIFSDNENLYKLKKIQKLKQPEGFAFNKQFQSGADQDNTFIFKAKKFSPFTADDETQKMYGQISDASKYYKLISAFKASGQNGFGAKNFKFAQDSTNQPQFFVAKKLNYNNQAPVFADNTYSSGFGFQAKSFPTIKVIKVVQQPQAYSFDGQSAGFGISPAQKFYQKSFVPQQAPVFKVVSPVHYTNTFGYKTLLDSQPIILKQKQISKVIKPLIVY